MQRLERPSANADVKNPEGVNDNDNNNIQHKSDGDNHL